MHDILRGSVFKDYCVANLTSAWMVNLFHTLYKSSPNLPNMMLFKIDASFKVIRITEAGLI